MNMDEQDGKDKKMGGHTEVRPPMKVNEILT